MSLEIIVEGHGEVEAVPILVRRIAIEIPPPGWIQISKRDITRIPRGSIIRESGIETAVEAASIRLGGQGSILVLLDSDDDNAEILRNALQTRAEGSAEHMNVKVIVIDREFESWIIHSIESLRGLSGIKNNVIKPENPEGIRGAKEWIGNALDSGSYSPIIDCPSLVSQMDISLSLLSNSFTEFVNFIKNV